MSDASLEKLQIEITAGTSDASKKIDKLVFNLGLLEQKLTAFGGKDVVSGFTALNSSLDKLSSTIKGMDDKKLKQVARSISSLAKSGSTLGNVSRSLGLVGQSAQTVGENLNGVSTERSVEQIQKEIDRAELLKQSANDVLAAFRNMASNLYIPEDIWGDLPTEQAKMLRGYVGIRNTSKTGNYKDLEAASQQLGIDPSSFMNESDLFIAVGERVKGLSEQVKGAESSLRSLHEELKAVENDWMFFGDVDVDDEELDWLSDSAGKAAESTRELGEELQSIQAVNPFQPLVDSLSQMGGLAIPAESIQSVTNLANAVKRLGGTDTAATMQSIVTGLNGMSGLTVPNLDGMAEFVKQIGKLNGVKVKGAVEVIPQLGEALRKLSSISELSLPSGERLTEFAQSINLLGRAKVEKAVTNIPQLANAIMKMMAALTSAPAVTQSVIDMTNAMARLGEQGSKIGSAGNSLTRVFSNVGTSGKRSGGLLSGLKTALANVSKHFKHTDSSGKSLAATIGLLYAKFWLLLRVFNILRKAMDLSSDVTEVQNVVNTVFGRYAGLVDRMAETSIEQFGMSELTVKETASRFQAMGSAMGITAEQVKKASDYLAKNNSVYDATGNKMADMSIELTKLTADMASFYNLEQDVVAEKLGAIFTGQTRPLREFGLDLTQATLKEWAMAEGLNADIQSMTQAEKTMLRYQYVMAHMNNTMGDFARTADTWANQTRILRQNFEQLGIVIGQGLINSLKPALRALNSFMQKVLSVVKTIVNALGSIFGWKMEINATGVSDDLGVALSDSADSLEDMSDAASGVGSGLADATDKAKELHQQLMGFDKLNVITTQKDSSGSGGSGGGSDAAGGGGDLADADTMITTTEGKFNSWIRNLEELGEYLNHILKKALLGIPWQDIYDKAYNFGKGFGEFIKGFTKDSETFYLLGDAVARVCNTILHAFDGLADGLGQEGFKQIGAAIAEFINGISYGIDWALAYDVVEKYAFGIAAAINEFVDRIDTAKIGKNLATIVNLFSTFALDLGKSINWEDIGKKFSAGVNGFIDNINATKLGRAFNTWANGILDVADTAISNINWIKLGTKIGTLLSEIDFSQLLSKFTKVLAKAIAGAIEGITFTFKEAPVESALLAAFALLKFTGVGKFVASQIVSSLGAQIGVSFAKDTAVRTAVVVALPKLIGNAVNSILTKIAISGGSIGAAFINGIVAAMSIAGPVALAVAAVVAIIAKVHDDLTVSEREMEAVFTDTGMDVCIAKTDSLKDSLDNLKRASEDIEEVYRTDILYASRQASQAEALISAYERLSQKEVLTYDEQEKLSNVTSELISIFPELNGYVNEEGQLVGVSAEKWKELVAQKKEDLEAEAKRSQYMSYYNKYSEAIDNARMAYTNYKDALQKVLDFQLLHKNRSIEEEKELDILKQKVSEAKDVYGQYGTQIELFGDHLNDLNDDLFGATTNYGALQVAQELMNEGLMAGDENLVQVAKDLANVAGASLDMSATLESAADSVGKLGTHASEAGTLYRDFVNYAVDSNGNLKISIDQANSWLENHKKNWDDLSTEAQQDITTIESELDRYQSSANTNIDGVNRSIDAHDKKLADMDRNVATVTKNAASNTESYKNRSNSAHSSIQQSLDKTKQSTDKAKEANDRFTGTASSMDAAGHQIKSGAETGASGMDTLKSATDDARSADDKLMSQSGKTFTISHSGFSDLISDIGSAISGLFDLFSFDGKSVDVSTNVSGNAEGGILIGDKWKKIQSYASGGLPTSAQLFMAREAGPELVGTIGGHNAVMNNDQIVSSVAYGVQNAVASSMQAQNAILSRQNEILKAILAKDLVISTDDIVSAARSGGKQYTMRTGRQAFVF